MENFISSHVNIVSFLVCLLAASTVYFFYNLETKKKNRCTKAVVAECCDIRTVRSNRRDSDNDVRGSHTHFIYSYRYFLDGKYYDIADGFISSEKLQKGHKRKFYINPDNKGTEAEFWDNGEHSICVLKMRVFLIVMTGFAVFGIAALFV